ncbi:MAG: hypothetical protein MH472_02120 [Bacteroidia bacterium]|nr:hypothetical protein [Bacteroidia bacterium]
MKNLTVSILSLVFVLFFGLNQSNAQGNRGRGNGMQAAMKERTDSLKIKLKLTEVQAAKFDEIMKRNREEGKQKMMELPEDANRMERAEVMKETMQKADAEILEILDSEQQAIYKKEKELEKEKMKAKAKERRKKK